MKYVKPVVTKLDLSKCFDPATIMTYGSDAGSCFIDDKW